MIEPLSTREMEKAFENAHQERSKALRQMFSSWFGLKSRIQHGIFGLPA